MHETPFETDFVEKVMIKAHRIMKPGGRFVLDIPRLGSPECAIAMMIEKYLGRVACILFTASIHRFGNQSFFFWMIEVEIWHVAITIVF